MWKALRNSTILDARERRELRVSLTLQNAIKRMSQNRRIIIVTIRIKIMHNLHNRNDSIRVTIKLKDSE